MTGGQDDEGSISSVEVFVPSTNKSCYLPSLPEKISRHSQDQLTQCGGEGSQQTCYTFTEGTWTNTARLSTERVGHRSWKSPDGIILIGGDGHERTTEIITESGVTNPGFRLLDDVQ